MGLEFEFELIFILQRLQFRQDASFHLSVKINNRIIAGTTEEYPRLREREKERGSETERDRDRETKRQRKTEKESGVLSQISV